jgi:hypothetical protein
VQDKIWVVFYDVDVAALMPTAAYIIKRSGQGCGFMMTDGKGIPVAITLVQVGKFMALTLSSTDGFAQDRYDWTLRARINAMLYLTACFILIYPLTHHALTTRYVCIIRT